MSKKLTHSRGLVVVWLIHGYQLLHPILHQLLITILGFSSTCRQPESCSNYTIRQIRNHGTMIGLKKGFSRILKCRSYATNH